MRRTLTAIAGREAWPGHAIRILADGVESLGATMELVRAAVHEVRFENFIFRVDAIGKTFARELRSRAEEGIDVRVLHDPVGAIMARRLPVDFLFRGSTVQARLLNLSWPSKPARALGRDHRKLVVADEARMVAGGICLADPWAGNCVRHCTWRDSAVWVEGPTAGEASRSFDRAWRDARSLFSQQMVPRPAREAPETGAAGTVPARIITDMGPGRRTEAILICTIEASRREIETGPMLWAAGGGLVTEVVALYLLYGRQKNNLNIRGAFWHVMQTFVGSILIIAAAIIIRFTGFLAIDPILGIVFGVVLFWASGGIIRGSLRILLQAVPDDLDLGALKAAAEAVPGVREAHHLHAWTLTTGKDVASLHLLGGRRGYASTPKARLRAPPGRVQRPLRDGAGRDHVPRTGRGTGTQRDVGSSRTHSPSPRPAYTPRSRQRRGADRLGPLTDLPDFENTLSDRQHEE